MPSNIKYNGDGKTTTKETTFCFSVHKLLRFFGFVGIEHKIQCVLFHFVYERLFNHIPLITKESIYTFIFIHLYLYPDIQSLKYIIIDIDSNNEKRGVMV